MAILSVLLILWTFYAVLKPTCNQGTRTPSPAHLQPAWAEPPNGLETQAGGQDGPAWSALDDRRLTRLLIDSAPRDNAE